MRTVGFDISTSCTAWTILDEAGLVVRLGHAELGKCDTFWEKVDLAWKQIHEDMCTYGCCNGASTVFVEQSLQSFRPGMSSANTLLTLAKFNGILSYKLREITGADPRYIASGEARRACGLKLVQLKKEPHGLGHKHQTFNAISGGLLSGRTWPEKRGAKPEETYAQRVVTWAMDEVDSYVIARAGWLGGSH